MMNSSGKERQPAKWNFCYMMRTILVDLRYEWAVLKPDCFRTSYCLLPLDNFFYHLSIAIGYCPVSGDCLAWFPQSTVGILDFVHCLHSENGLGVCVLSPSSAFCASFF